RTGGGTVVSTAAPRALTMPSMPSSRRIQPARVSNSYSFSLFISNPRKLFFSNPNKRSNVYRSSIVAKAGVEKRLPDATLPYIDRDGEMQTTTLSELTQGKKIFVWTVRSLKNLKRCVKKAEEFKADGLESVVIVVGNDASVVKEWKKDLGISDDIRLLIDVDSQYTMAMYVELGPNENPFGLGIYLEDGVVKYSDKRSKKGFGAPR
ncbi:hypothetical protein KI387_000069, partial [Taxus chinensis]